MITHPATRTRIRTNAGTPSPYYIGYYPMNQWIDDGAGGRTYNKITLTNSVAVDTGNDWYSGVTSAAWLVAGLPIRIRPTGTIPAPLSANTQYYAGKPTADRLTIHTTEAAALAGTGKIDITDTGSVGSTSIIYPSIVYDRSGQGNHLLFGTSLADSGASYGAWQKIATVPGMSSGTNSSQPTTLGSISAAVFNARWNWPDYSLLIAARITPYGPDGIVTGGRALMGCGFTAVSDGPRIQTGTTADEFRAVMFFGGSGSDSATFTDTVSGTIAVDAPTHIITLYDAGRMLGTCWLDGVPDISVQNRPLNEGVGNIGAVSAASHNFYVGGVSTNCQAATFRDVHILSIPVEHEISMPQMHRLARTLAGTNGYCLQDGDI